MVLGLATRIVEEQTGRVRRRDASWQRKPTRLAGV